MREGKQQSADSATLGEQRLEARTVGGLHELAFAALEQRLGKSASILDLGAGTGAWADRLIRHNYRVTALDRDENCFGSAQARFVRANLDTNFANAFRSHFDAVTAIEVIEHLENPTHFLGQCSQLLTDQGILLLTTPNIECAAGRLRFLMTGNFRMFDRDERLNDPTHISPIQSYMFEKMAKTSGLRILSHRTAEALPAVSRRSIRLMTSLIGHFIRGNKIGDCHIFILTKSSQTGRS
jgi:2-polyprenyl-3-methyl-5-hydroxy-6-metoxy-1,4-benzoquinol methylase